MTTPEAFLLLTLSNTTLAAFGSSQSGILNLECVTVPVPDSSNPVERDVYLVLRLGTIETPLDPARVIQKTDGPGYKRYTFQATESDASELVVSVTLPPDGQNSHFAVDLETFETIFAQYGDLRGGTTADIKSPVPPTTPKGSEAYGDLRGHLVVVNQDNGEVVGEFDDSQFKVQEDPKLYERGHEQDAVIIEVPDTQTEGEGDGTALQMFIRAVPPDQQDWITKSATIVSHAISATTNLLLTTITTASNYYTTHSTLSPQASPQPRGASPSVPAPPSRVLVFLTSERTRKGLATVHAVSGQAVKVSSKTVSTIDSMIRRAMGGKAKKERQLLPKSPSPAPGMLSPTHSQSSSAGKTPPQLPPRTPSPSRSALSLPPPYPGLPSTGSGGPALPPRRSPSPVPPLPPPHTQEAHPLTRKERVLLSADLILSTLDQEGHRLLNAGTETIGNIVEHKYGPGAGEASRLIAGTARNVALVYVDMTGIGRRALLKRAGKQFVKARVSGNRL